MDGPNGVWSTDAHVGAEPWRWARPSQPFEGVGHRIDEAKAAKMHPQAKKVLADKATAPGLRRTMVKTAVIMGFPVER